MPRKPNGTRADIWRFIAEALSTIHTWRTLTWIRYCYRNKTSQKRYWSDHFGLYGMKVITSVRTDTSWDYATFRILRVPGKKNIQIRFLNRLMGKSKLLMLNQGSRERRVEWISFASDVRWALKRSRLTIQNQSFEIQGSIPLQDGSVTYSYG